MVSREEEFVSRSSGKKTYGVRTLAPIEPDLVLSIFDDRTELKQKEEALKRSEERLKSLFKGGPLTTIVWRAENGDFVLMDFNQVAEERTKGKIEEYLGTRASEFYKDSPNIQVDMQECLKTKAVVQKELTYHARADQRHLRGQNDIRLCGA